MFLDHFDAIPWEALRYMVAEANYGERVIYQKDMITIILILEEIYIQPRNAQAKFKTFKD